MGFSGRPAGGWPKDQEEILGRWQSGCGQGSCARRPPRLQKTDGKKQKGSVQPEASKGAAPVAPGGFLPRVRYKRFWCHRRGPEGGRAILPTDEITREYFPL